MPTFYSVSIGRARCDVSYRYKTLLRSESATTAGDPKYGRKPGRCQGGADGVRGSACGQPCLSRCQGDPLLVLDQIYNSIPDASARARLVAVFDIEVDEPRDFASATRRRSAGACTCDRAGCPLKTPTWSAPPPICFESQSSVPADESSRRRAALATADPVATRLATSILASLRLQTKPGS